jgi:hypothetical protein
MISMDIYVQRNIGLHGFAFDFAKYTFHDGTYCIVTNLMTSQFYMPDGIEPRVKKKILPIIWGQTNN